MVNAGAQELQLMSALLAAPTPESLPLLQEVAAPYHWLQPALDELARTALPQWQAEHTRLFINGYPDTPCLPFASHWRHGCMQGPVVDEISELLGRIGVASEQLPPDYLGVLLECAALLRDAGTAEADALLAELAERQLQPWLPQLAAALQQHSGLRLYQLLGERLQELCHDGE